MSPQEWWWEFDAKMAAQKKIEAAREKHGGVPSADAWAKARALHTEKVEKLRNGGR